MDSIRGFQGEYEFLSNFFDSPIVTAVGTFPTAEHMYQYCKTFYATEWAPDQARLILVAATPKIAKRRGREVKLDLLAWEVNKDMWMRRVLRKKFDQATAMQRALINTSPAYLEETNWWGDTYWGVSNNKGENRLGIMLMELRGYYINEESVQKIVQRTTTRA